MNREKLKSIILNETRKLFENREANLLIDSKLSECNEKEGLIRDFIDYCTKFLTIDIEPTIELVADRKEHNIRTTAFYDPGSHMIKIYCKGRAIVDVCRSIAHELTHMSQNLKGEIEFPVQDAGGHIEDEANAKAGEIVKLYAKSKPERMMIYERRSVKL